jgi:hypothetical protein
MALGRLELCRRRGRRDVALHHDTASASLGLDGDPICVELLVQQPLRRRQAREAALAHVPLVANLVKSVASDWIRVRTTDTVHFRAAVAEILVPVVICVAALILTG